MLASLLCFTRSNGKRACQLGFFNSNVSIYAKGKSETSVAEYTSCNVDRICKYIDGAVPRRTYKIFDSEEINPQILIDKEIITVSTTTKDKLEIAFDHDNDAETPDRALQSFTIDEFIEYSLRDVNP